MKSKMPIQKEICQKIGIKDPKTYRVHLHYLIETGYVIDNIDKYILPDKEDIYLLIPIETLKFIYDTLREPVIKTYIYLGQRFKYKKDYLFTKKEIAEHLGINDKRANEKIENYLKVLSHCGLISFEHVYNKKVSMMKLTNWSTHARR